MIKKFRKKPVIVEAIQFNGKNRDEIEEFVGESLGFSIFDKDISIETIYIRTLEGLMKANPNDWIIKGVEGEFYPCKPDIFKETYEEVK